MQMFYTIKLSLFFEKISVIVDICKFKASNKVLEASFSLSRSLSLKCIRLSHLPRILHDVTHSTVCGVLCIVLHYVQVCVGSLKCWDDYAL